jgi:cell wall-associated NlpC family hydrolase
MKKYVIMASILITLAGCSASASLASIQSTTVTTHYQGKQLSLIEVSKAHKNAAQMRHVVKYLKTRIGRTSYVFSGSSPRGWDCSGLVRWTYEQFGIELPHSANKQGHLGARVSKPKLGDIVVFAYNGSTNFYHAALYIGNGKIINANYGSGTTIIQPLTDYKGSQIRFVRVIKTL